MYIAYSPYIAYSSYFAFYVYCAFRAYLACITYVAFRCISVHYPAVVGLAGMVQEQPTNWLAGMDPAEIYIYKQKYAVLCKNMLYANI